MLLLPFFIGGFAIAKEDPKKPGATEEDLFLYRAIGATYICVAREADIEFSKAAAIAAITYVNLLEGRHGARIKEIGDKKFSRKELIYGANNALLPATVEFCPDKVPKETKKEVKKFLKELKKNNKKK
ncbi:putative Villin headpiece domain [Prochlorococcus sp. MIT 0603]|nr:putative Villin headpiece domain [Prochlorococcus sp. MIT 0603]